MRVSWLSWIVAAAFAACTLPATAQCPANPPVQGAPPPLPVFPASNWWNLDISTAPVDPASATYINFIGPTRGMHPDFGGEEEPGSENIYGFPYAIVDGTQDKLPVTFEVWDESDGVNMATGEGVPFYPIPIEAIDEAHWIEGGPPGTTDIRDDSDRHLLMVDCTNRHLYELYNVWFDESESQWVAYSGAFFDLDTNARRPDTWTSADAAGLAIFPGLVRYDEASNAALTTLGHALRMTVRATNGYVYPASHRAGSTSGALPMGARLRLKALVGGQDPALRTNDAMARRIFRSMQKYGLIVADNGSDMYVSGTFDTRWNNDILNPAFSLLKASDFEVVQLGWNPPPPTTPTLSIAHLSIVEGNSGTSTATFVVSLSQATGSTVSFNAATENGTAVSGSDYVAKTWSGLTIPAGQLSKTVSVTLNGDTAVEANEAFYVRISAVTNAIAGTTKGKATVLNDDGPTLTIADPTAISEGNSGTKTMTFTVKLSQPTNVPVTYTIATASYTATAGSDFVARTLTGETIPAGQTSRTFAVTLNGDTTAEANERVLVNLSAVTGVSLLDPQGRGTILNDDGVTLSMGHVTVTEGNSGTRTASFPVTLSQPSSATVSFNVTTLNGTAVAGTDFNASTQTGLTIPAGQTSRTVNVTVKGDTTVEANEAFYLTATSASNATVLSDKGKATLLNDDGPTLSINDVSTSEGNSGTKTLTFTVSLSQVAAGAVTYSIATANHTATAGSDYVAKTATGQTIPAGQLAKTFAVTINGDTAVEASELLLVNLSAVTGASVLDAQGRGTITNDD